MEVVIGSLNGCCRGKWMWRRTRRCLRVLRGKSERLRLIEKWRRRLGEPTLPPQGQGCCGRRRSGERRHGAECRGRRATGRGMGACRRRRCRRCCKGHHTSVGIRGGGVLLRLRLRSATWKGSGHPGRQKGLVLLSGGGGGGRSGCYHWRRVLLLLLLRWHLQQPLGWGRVLRR